MLYELTTNEQKEKFDEVINDLTLKGHKQKEIATRIGITPQDISRLKSGILKNIPPEVIDNLHEEYHINPNFIVKGSHNMYDMLGVNYENFENFVDRWDLVDHENESYLHFFMSENFYNFLKDVYKLKSSSPNSNNSKGMTEAFEKAFESVKENFSDSNNSKEFVLIPADDVLEIATNNVARRKQLNEVIDIFHLSPPK